MREGSTAVAHENLLRTGNSARSAEGDFSGQEALTVYGLDGPPSPRLPDLRVLGYSPRVATS